MQPLWRLVWTRDLADAEADRSLFAALPATPPKVERLHLPCVTTADVVPTWKTAGFDQVVFTSPKGVEHALSDARLRAAIQTLPAHAFGESTGRALAAAGFKPHMHAVKSSEDLAKALLGMLPPGMRIALPGPDAPAYDLAGTLRQGGHQAEAIVCYKTTSAMTDDRGQPLSATERSEYVARLTGAVCFLSPSAVNGFVAGFGRDVADMTPRLTAVVIGATTAAATVPYFGQVLTAPEQSAAAVAGMAHAVVSHLMQASSRA